LVTIDRLTRYCVAAPLRNQKAETVTEAFVLHWVYRNGDPMRMHSGQGSNSESTLPAETRHRLHVAKSHTMAYNPQSNGAVERVNRTLINSLRTLCCDKLKTRDQYLQQALFANNSTPHRSTEVWPYQLIHGEEARLSVELQKGFTINWQTVHECRLFGFTVERTSTSCF
jgi:transposase InsO family protein